MYEEDGDSYTIPEKISSYCTIKNGKISVVEEHICGDVNEDGEVNSIDLVCLSRHLAGWTGYGKLLLPNNE